MHHSHKSITFWTWLTLAFAPLLCPTTAYACQAARSLNADAIHFDTDSADVLVDSGSSYSLSPSLDDFVSMYPVPHRSLRLDAVNGGAYYPTVRGTVHYRILADDNTEHTIVLPDTVYYPAAPIRIMSPQHWAQTRRDKHNDSTAECRLRADVCRLEWTNDGTHFTTTMPLCKKNVGLLYTSPGLTHFAASNFATHLDPDKDPLRRKALMTDFASDNHKHPDHTAADRLASDFLLLHERLGHLSWTRLRGLAAANVIPRRYLHARQPVCPGCQYGKAHRRPWRGPSQHNKIFPVTHPGDYTYVHPMESLSATDTIDAKVAFEDLARSHGVTVQHYHCDNGRFADNAFRQHAADQNQTLSFCGVNAHHQNGKAERCIRDLTEAARTSLLHAAHRWPSAVTVALWPQALKHATQCRNIIPSDPAKRPTSPLTLFTGLPNTCSITDIHPFGCPVYVLATPLQQQQAVPKWSDRARVGVYLCHSPHHASTVHLILNTHTGLVSPQFHCVFDDHFDSIAHDKLSAPSWLTRELDTAVPTVVDNPVIPLWPLESPATAKNSEGELTPTRSATPQSPLPYATHTTEAPEHHYVTRSGRRTQLPTRYQSFAAAAIAAISTVDDERYLPHHGNAMAELSAQGLAYSSTADADTMTLQEAMQQDDKQQFLDAMQVEINAHTQHKHWEIVAASSKPPQHKPINMVWSMKRKRDPAGAIIKWKARLCAHGGMQEYGRNYWETYAPVVSWTTVRLVLILSLILQWHTISIDFVLAYPQADIKTDIYMRMPRGCHLQGYNNSDIFLKLKKNLYGLKDAGLTWHNHIKEGLLKRGYKQCQHDPCLFMTNTTLIALYVDDAIIASPNKEDAEALVESLKKDFALTVEGELKDYLGVRFTRHSDGSTTLEQTAMIERCLKALNLHDDPKVHSTPAQSGELLQPHLDSPTKDTTWEYRSVIGMLNYVQAMTRPDISYSVHQAARYCSNPREPHKQFVKRIGRYLAGTKEHGITLRPDATKGFECFVDADWAGDWVKERDDIASMLSRSGYVITFAGCPLLWASRMQSLIALSTTEAELIALSAALREVLALVHLMQELHDNKLPIPIHTPVVKCEVFEDNASTVCIANEDKLRPRTKHVAARELHFRQHVKLGTIKIQHIKTSEQLADIFTKPLPRNQFQYLRQKIMGW